MPRTYLLLSSRLVISEEKLDIYPVWDYNGCPMPIPTKSIPVEKLAEVLRIDPNSPTGLTWLPSSSRPGLGNKPVYGHRGSKKYFRIEVCGERYAAHRVVWALAYGSISEEQQIDHIDGDGFNNRLENLRSASNLLNANSRHRTNGNQYFGVEQYPMAGGRVVWRCRFSLYEARVSLGVYPTEEEAAQARDKWFRDCGIQPSVWNFEHPARSGV